MIQILYFSRGYTRSWRSLTQHTLFEAALQFPTSHSLPLTFPRLTSPLSTAQRFKLRSAGGSGGVRASPFPPNALSRPSTGLKNSVLQTCKYLLKAFISTHEQFARRVASGGDPPEADRETQRGAGGRGGQPGDGWGAAPAPSPLARSPGGLSREAAEGHPAAGGEAATPRRGKTSPLNECRASFKP